MIKADEILYGQHSRHHLPLEARLSEPLRFRARVRYAPGPDDSSGLVFDETMDGQPIAFIDLAVCDGEYQGLKVQADLRMEGLGEEAYYLASQAFSSPPDIEHVRSISDQKLKLEAATDCLARGLDRCSVVAEIVEHPHIGFCVDDFVLNSAEPLE